MKRFNSWLNVAWAMLVPFLVLSILSQSQYSHQEESPNLTAAPAADENEQLLIGNFFENNLKLAYGSMLNVSCSYNDDCILKNSACNPLTKRCECMPNLLNDNKLCPVSFCSSMQECYDNYEHSACILGRCQCLYGLKPNGQCASPEPGVSSKQLPDWGIYLIAISAMFGGVFGGRSKAIAAIVRNLVEVFVLISGLLDRSKLTNNSSVEMELEEFSNSVNHNNPNGNIKNSNSSHNLMVHCQGNDTVSSSSDNTEIAVPLLEQPSKSRPSSPTAQLTIVASFNAQQQ